ncbi:serine protease [Planotetraspora silvatica]|uniref:Serine protease n=1 Tax=Planotetraspora silvatica TaxID=234614 RepID=A0A8J3UEF0_9ACTN|nr:S8 family serine peptidase [Planotetraspora silvatica]GII43703.1 serine protease [Planotetraspora silvatica]
MKSRGRVAKALFSIALVGVASAATAGVSMPVPKSIPPGKGGDYLVFYADGARDTASRAVTAAGGVIESQDDRLGYLIVRAPAPEPLADSPSVVGVTPDLPIGSAADMPMAAPPPKTSGGAKAVAGDPLSDRQWDMKMIGATPTGSYAKARGNHQVLVGIIDTGVDGNHPDIAANFNRQLSRNFVTDLPNDVNGKKFDGACEVAGCKDPADEDDDGHGTHVASTIGSPINGIGVAGVAPDVSLVNLRAGTDSGYFFLKPTMDALAYAGDVGVDVVNMSFYVDPWTFNCAASPQDSRADQLAQRGILVGMRRAVAYAHQRGVTMVTAIGNSGSDLGRPSKDTASPDYPLGAEKERTVDNTCLNVPTELPGVIAVSSVGPSGQKAAYSDYGVEQTDIAAPGGDIFDSGTSLIGERREILAAAPTAVLKAGHQIDASGNPVDASVVRDCHGGTCAYYQYLEGTSMAAPHVTGIAAIIISRFGVPGKGGLAMDPNQVEKLLYASATQTSCPTPRAFKYGTATQTCEGTKEKNGFFGHGIANAAQAATVTP